MKKVAIAIGVVLGLFVLLGIGQLVASESGEVLVLETLDADAQPHETRIWVVDAAGSIWVCRETCARRSWPSCRVSKGKRIAATSTRRGPCWRRGFT